MPKSHKHRILMCTIHGQSHTHTHTLNCTQFKKEKEKEKLSSTSTPIVCYAQKTTWAPLPIHIQNLTPQRHENCQTQQSHMLHNPNTTSQQIHTVLHLNRINQCMNRCQHIPGLHNPKLAPSMQVHKPTLTMPSQIKTNYPMHTTSTQQQPNPNNPSPSYTLQFT